MKRLGHRHPWSLNRRGKIICLLSISEGITLKGVLKETLPLALQQLLIQSHVVPCHSLRRKTSLELVPDFASIQS